MNNGVMIAGEGRSIWVIGDRYTIKCCGNDTSGAYALLEAIVPPGGGPPPHFHSREDKAFYVLEGNSSSMSRVAVSPQLLEPGLLSLEVRYTASRTPGRSQPGC